MVAIQAQSASGRSRISHRTHPSNQAGTANGNQSVHLAPSAPGYRDHGLHGQCGQSHTPTTNYHTLSTATASASFVLPIDIPTTSNISLFLTNLCLLDLDQLHDWPHISSQTFASTKDPAGQGQKRRIQCVEWALYQLFCLWDPSESRSVCYNLIADIIDKNIELTTRLCFRTQKLQPYFPPLDQVQSLNLRAALLRCLEQAKKSGHLGRDAVVRRTMLDECKGEQLEEILARFSSIVLKKVISETAEAKTYPPIALVAALEQRNFSADKTQLNGLVLAHKVLLNKLLREKAVNRAHYRDFCRVLDARDKKIAQRKAEIEAIAGQRQSGLSNEQKLVIRRTLRNNWSGNDRWMETILYGDTSANKDAVLASPFDRVWRRVQAGRLSELEENTTGLLGQLDARVKMQRDRLERWEEFRQKLGVGSTLIDKDNQKYAESTLSKKGIDLGFHAHKKIRPDNSTFNIQSTSRRKGAGPTGEYARILDSLKLDLEMAGKPQSRNLLSYLVAKRPDSPNSNLLPNMSEPSAGHFREIEEEPNLPHRRLHNSISPSAPAQQLDPERINRRSKILRSNHDMQRPEKSRRAMTVSHGDNSKGKLIGHRQNASDSACIQTAKIPSNRPTRTSMVSSESILQQNDVRDAFESSSQVTEVEQQGKSVSQSPTQTMADEILASVSNMSPSPIKRSSRANMSLEERTRLSMIRGNKDEDSRLSISPKKPAVTAVVEQMNDGADSTNDLVARTRLSMAGFKAAKQKAQLERRRSEKKSRKLHANPMRRETVSRYLDEMEEEWVASQKEEQQQRQQHQQQEQQEQQEQQQIASERGNLAVYGEEDTGDISVIAEELIIGGGSSQADYETVFMSRPKIKTSPLPSPVPKPR